MCLGTFLTKTFLEIASRFTASRNFFQSVNKYAQHVSYAAEVTQKKTSCMPEYTTWQGGYEVSTKCETSLKVFIILLLYKHSH